MSHTLHFHENDIPLLGFVDVVVPPAQTSLPQPVVGAPGAPFPAVPPADVVVHAANPVNNPYDTPALFVDQSQGRPPQYQTPSQRRDHVSPVLRFMETQRQMRWNPMHFQRPSGTCGYFLYLIPLPCPWRDSGRE